MNENTHTKARPAIFALNVGESLVFPIEKMKNVRTQASELGAIYERQYVTRTNRIDRTIEVTRIK